MANTDRIEQVFDRITAETLNMGHWAQVKGTDTPEGNMSCGTTMCFAGHAAVAAGKTLWWEKKKDYDGNLVGYTADFTTDGESVEEFARDWLDLDWDEAHRIFYATGIGNDVDMLRDHVNTVIHNPYDQSRYEVFGGGGYEDDSDF